MNIVHRMHNTIFLVCDFQPVCRDDLLHPKGPLSSKITKHAVTKVNKQVQEAAVVLSLKKRGCYGRFDA